MTRCTERESEGKGEFFSKYERRNLSANEWFKLWVKNAAFTLRHGLDVDEKRRRLMADVLDEVAETLTGDVGAPKVNQGERALMVEAKTHLLRRQGERAPISKALEFIADRFGVEPESLDRRIRPHRQFAQDVLDDFWEDLDDA